MNAEAKQQWLKALRSGAYTQGRRFLRTETGYCCLGVLGDIVDSTRWREYQVEFRELNGTVTTKYYPFGAHCSSSYLPEEMEAQLGITRDQSRALAIMNDDGKTFAEIADYIEKNL